MIRRKNTRRDRNGGAHEKSQESELKRSWVAFEDHAAHWRLKFKGLPQIAADNLTKVMPILDNQRLVEAQGMAQLFDLPRRCAFPQHLLDRVARNDMDQQKNHGEHQPERGEREQKAMKEVARHVYGNSNLLGIGF